MREPKAYGEYIDGGRRFRNAPGSFILPPALLRPGCGRFAAPGQWVRMVGGQVMGIRAAMSAWVHVHVDDGKAWLRVKEHMAHLLNHPVTLARRQVLVHDDV